MQFPPFLLCTVLRLTLLCGVIQRSLWWAVRLEPIRCVSTTISLGYNSGCVHVRPTRVGISRYCKYITYFKCEIYTFALVFDITTSLSSLLAAKGLKGRKYKTRRYARACLTCLRASPMFSKRVRPLLIFCSILDCRSGPCRDPANNTTGHLLLYNQTPTKIQAV